MLNQTYQAHHNYRITLQTAFVELFNRYGKMTLEQFKKKANEHLVNNAVGNFSPSNDPNQKNQHLMTFQTDKEVISLYYRHFLNHRGPFDNFETITQKTFNKQTKSESLLGWRFDIGVKPYQIHSVRIYLP